MPRCLTAGISLAMAAAGLAPGAIFPENWAGGKLAGAVSPMTLPDKPVAGELGFEAGEKAVYQAKAGKFEVAAWRFRDPTSALVYYFSTRPEGSKAASGPLLKAEPLAETYSKGIFLAHGNYVLQIEGPAPRADDLKVLYGTLPRLDQSSLPSLPAYLPSEELKAGSERYVVGPATLERYEPRIGAAMAAFSLGAEAVVADYGKAGRLSIFNYPTNEMARQRTEEFRKLPSAVVKRSGPLVALMLGSEDPNAAERVLAKVNYQAALTWNEPTPDAVVKNGAKMMLSIFALAGVLCALAVASGVVFGLLRYMRRKYGPTDLEEAMITLDLGKQ